MRDSYRVLVGSLSIECKEIDLTAAQSKKIKQVQNKLSIKNLAPKLTGTPALDLHGKTASEASSLVQELISRACLENREKVEIVHGIGSGRLKDTVWKTLSALKVVRHFKLDETNPGKTVAYL
jgi:DNA mismatch repair protein MutS2